MKTPDFDAEARYVQLGERHSAVIAPDRSLDVYAADFDQVDFDMEMISGWWFRTFGEGWSWNKQTVRPGGYHEILPRRMP